MREKLPDRRYAEVFEFEHRYPAADARKFTASAGFYPLDKNNPKGRIGEAFVHAINGKEKLLNADQRDAATLLSIALQYGASLKELKKSMLGSRNGVPHGFMGSLIDQLLEIERSDA